MLGAARLTLGRKLSYADFVASITAKAVNGSKGPNDLPSGASGAGAGKFIVAFSGAPSDTLMGSSWNSVFAGGQSRYGTAARHAYPSQTPFTENTTNNRTVYMELTYPGEADTYTALNRNGFLSDGSTANPRSSYKIVQFVWWDVPSGGPLTLNPSIGGSPVAYVP